MKGIPELNEIYALEQLADEYEARFGAPPANLSHWDPSEDTMRALSARLILPTPPATMAYIYGDELSIQRQVLDRLGVTDIHRECLIVPNGTAATLLAVTWLRAIGITKLLVLCPAYFAVFYACELIGVPYAKAYMLRSDGRWSLPQGVLDAASRTPGTAVWVTNPVYCAGDYLDDTAAAAVNALIDHGRIVVTDDCVAIDGRELGRRIHPSPAHVGLYSPHKAVCLNAVKFACLTFQSEYSRHFADWSDVLVGGLGLSVYAATLHFIGEHFASFRDAFLERVAAERFAVRELLGKYAAGVEIDRHVDGYFMTCYFPWLAADQVDATFLRNLVFATGAVMIPGARNHFPIDVGFCFRLNLARASPQFRGGLVRVIRYLRGCRP